MKKILVFIPAYNVENYIFLLFKQIPKTIFKKNKIQFLIINDNSSDNTYQELLLEQIKDKNLEIEQLKKVISEKVSKNKSITQQYTNLKSKLSGLVN